MSGITIADLQGERRAVAIPERVQPPRQTELVPGTEQTRHDDDGERDPRQRGEAADPRRLQPPKQTEEEPREAADPRTDAHEVEPLREDHPRRAGVTTGGAREHRAGRRDRQGRQRRSSGPQERGQHGDPRHADGDRQQDELPSRFRREQRPERHTHGRILGERHQDHADRPRTPSKARAATAGRRTVRTPRDPSRRRRTGPRDRGTGANGRRRPSGSGARSRRTLRARA